MAGKKDTKIKGPVVIVCLGFANGERCPHEGYFLESFDHEAFHGRGYGEFTRDPSKAKRFKDAGEALEFWNRVPKSLPRRPDGKPNKPMTSMHMEIVLVSRVMQ